MDTFKRVTLVISRNWQCKDIYRKTIENQYHTLIIEAKAKAIKVSVMCTSSQLYLLSKINLFPLIQLCQSALKSKNIYHPQFRNKYLINYTELVVYSDCVAPDFHLKTKSSVRKVSGTTMFQLAKLWLETT